MTRINNDDSNPCIRAAVYTFYNLGVLSLAVGIVRTAISLAYIAKHFFYQKRYELTINKKLRDIQGENQLIHKGLSLVGQGAKKVGEYYSASQCRKPWKKELKRGILEMCLIGGPIYTYQDNFGERKVSILGLDELNDKMENESSRDMNISYFYQDYKPWY